MPCVFLFHSRKPWHKCQGYGNKCQGYGNKCQGYGNKCQGYGNKCQGYGNKCQPFMIHNPAIYGWDLNSATES
ncbi:MAG: hypothetical protein EOM83_17500 [Clostridia bacterium]|nr:hypothetical protein [Clostridia bacterium]